VGEFKTTKTTITTHTDPKEIRKALDEFFKKEPEKSKTVKFKVPFEISVPSSAQPAFDLIAKLEQVIKILELAIEKSAEGQKTLESLTNKNANTNR